jgi:Adenosine specific kinase
MTCRPSAKETPVDIEIVTIDKPDALNVIVGQGHFIKTVEDLYEVLACVSPQLRFGIAFCESSGPAGFAEPATTTSWSSSRSGKPEPSARDTASWAASSTVNRRSAWRPTSATIGMSRSA